MTLGNSPADTPRLAIRRIGRGETYEVLVSRLDENGKVRLLYMNQAKLGRQQTRTAIVVQIAERYHLNPEDLEKFILDEIAVLSKQESPPHEPTPAFLMHPAGYFSPELSAIVVPEGRADENGWLLCVQHRGGRREIVSLCSSVAALEDGSTVLVDPIPTTAADTSVWPKDRRVAWGSSAPAADPCELVERLAVELDRYVRFPGTDETHETWSITVATFAAFTFVYAGSRTTPYLRLSGPTASGKTRVLEILARVAFRPTLSASLSPAALFRVVHDQGGTVLIDEAEHLTSRRSGSAEILSLLLSGYKWNGTVHRVEGARVRTYRTFSPKAYAAIEESEPTLVSRSITLPMFRDVSARVNRLLDDSTETWNAIRAGFCEASITFGCELAETFRRPVACGLTGRNRELWAPLIQLANWFDETGRTKDLKDRLIAHAREVIAQSQVDLMNPIDELLLRTLADQLSALVDSKPHVTLADCPRPADVVIAARLRDPQAVRGLSVHRAAAVLRRYGVRTHQSNLHVYELACLDRLRAVQRAYGVQLGLRDQNLADDRTAE